MLAVVYKLIMFTC